MKCKKWVLVSKFDGEPKDEDLQLQEEDLPELQSGDVLLEGIWWSVDPYMRPMAGSLPAGSLMPGQHLTRVLQSKNDNYPVGKLLLASVGWRSHTVCNPDTLDPQMYHGTSIPKVVPPVETGNLPTSVTLGVLGMPGATAYFGLLEICRPKAGETVLVNGAAGAVGSLVGQIAKIKGCKVIGFAGTDAKVKHVKEELGFDHVFNYKKVDVNTALKEAAPNGIDCYFDNVGGEFTTNVLIHHMNTFGRVAICGSISRYNSNPMKPAMAPEMYMVILSKQLNVEGFIVYRWAKKFPQAGADMLSWIQQGKLKYKEHITEGFENMRSAFYGILKGENTGKAVIKATSDNTKL